MDYAAPVLSIANQGRLQNLEIKESENVRKILRCQRNTRIDIAGAETGLQNTAQRVGVINAIAAIRLMKEISEIYG